MFEAFNDTGTLQFDTRGVTYRFIEKETDTSVFIDGGGLLDSGWLTRSNPAARWDLFAVACTDWVGLFDHSNVDYDGRTDDKELVITNFAAGQTVDTFFFDLAKNSTITSTQDSGLQIFDDAGDLLYSSELTPLRVVDYFTTDVVGQSGLPYSVTLASGRDYAVMPIGRPGLDCKVNANVVDIRIAGSPPPMTSSITATGALIVDVTGY